MKIKFLGFFLLAVVSIQVLAMDQSSGCGPGWYLFKDNSIVSSAFRSTTNLILFPVVTIGMTFGTSNCTQHKLVLKEKESLYFVTMNHNELKRDIAKGDGEYLSAFAETMGCPAGSQLRLNEQLRKNYGVVYPSAEAPPERILLEVYKTIFTDHELTSKCSLGIG
jgi:hypothetical protein